MEAATQITRESVAFELERTGTDLTTFIGRVDEGHFPTPSDRDVQQTVARLLENVRAVVERSRQVAAGESEPLSRSELDLVYVCDVILTGYGRDLNNDGRAVKRAIRLILDAGTEEES